MKGSVSVDAAEAADAEAWMKLYKNEFTFLHISTYSSNIGFLFLWKQIDSEQKIKSEKNQIWKKKSEKKLNLINIKSERKNLKKKLRKKLWKKKSEFFFLKGGGPDPQDPPPGSASVKPTPLSMSSLAILTPTTR